MAFNIKLLTGLTYDEAEPLLDSYIHSALDQFITSKTGKAHIKKYPTGGFWIGTFIEFAYLYGEVTLPEMTKGDAKYLMEEILPRKLTLMDPEQANDAIPELIAFWTFLKEDYKLRSAGAIAKYLQSIQGKFKPWMSDPDRGGFAKNFIMAGMESGVDMNSEMGIRDFQQIYNQQIRNDNLGNLLGNTKVPMVAPPAEIQEFLDLMGVELPQAGEMVDSEAAMAPVFEAMAQLEEFFDSQPPQSIIPQQASPDPDLRTMMLGNIPKKDVLTSDEIQLLQSQTITETSPGTILQDVETALDFLGTKGVPVSAKRQHMGGKYLQELNQMLSHPNEHGLIRPTQKSYPSIQGLYLLLRASRLVSIRPKGKKLWMYINTEVLEQWKQLNPTEKYFTLLEAWMIQGHGELLGDDIPGHLSEGDRTLKDWSYQLGKTAQTYASYGEQERFVYWPGYHNLTLLEGFGFLRLTPGKPTKGKGWRLKKTEPLPWGQAIMALLLQVYFTQERNWESITNPSLALQELQPIVSPYFPEWKHCLTFPQRSFRAGQYIFKVVFGKIWRLIAIDANATLADLSYLILESVDFDNDHLDSYTFKDEWGRSIEAMHPYAEPDLATDEVLIGNLPIEVGDTMDYLFDFGDCWQFTLELQEINPESKSKSKKRKGAPGKILESHGKAPEQYPMYED